MHAGDPVSWQTWQGAALARAKRERKLVYVSVGYFSCHWCHVMHRESYEDVDIARILNERFVPVKVDRELQPALDDHLMGFVVATLGHGGWPLNVFLTPDGYPLVGFTYLPPERFRTLLERLSERWGEDRDRLEQSAREAARLIQEQRTPSQNQPLTRVAVGTYLKAYIRQSAELADLEAGGFGEGNKFPMTAQLRGLLEFESRHPDPALDRFLRLTLERMAAGGMRDQLGGGFFRYSTDRHWRVPHFEKMLYDNALLAELYLDASRLLDEPAYRAVVTSTLDFMIADLWQDQALLASLSAVDDADVEGGYYLWRDETLAALLSENELAVARLAWNLEGPPTLEHGRLPQVAASDDDIARRLGHPVTRVAALREAALAKLLTERERRGLPRDVKLLAGWNGLALAVLARAALVSDPDGRYRRVASALRDYLSGTLWDGSRLARAVGPDGPLGTASLQDYAFVARGLIAHAELSGEQRDLALSRDIVDAAWRRFRATDGWRQSEDPLIPHGRAEAVLADGALPSPSAVLLESTLELAARQNDAALRQRAEEVLWRDHPALGESPYTYATHLGLLSRHPPPAGDEP
jgi:uncharacterized protein YyaL (SSP411 family)